MDQTHDSPRPPAPSRRFAAEGITGDADREAAAARAAALLPAELLQPHEIIILLLKPSPWFIVLAPLKTLAILALLTLAMLVLNKYLPLGIANRDLVLLGVGLIGLRLFWQFLEWLSRVYVLTDQRMIRVEGVLRVSIFEARLREIQHTELILAVRERVFGLGSIAFATAGTAATEVYWLMLAQPLEVHQKVVQTLRRYRR